MNRRAFVWRGLGAALLLGAAAMAVGGCAGASGASDAASGEDRGSTERAESARPVVAARSASPSVVIVRPAAGGRTGRTVRVGVRTRNFVADPANVGTRLIDGHGHFHFSLDGGRYDFPRHSSEGKNAVRAGTQGRFSPTTRPSIVYRNLPRGRHRLVVRLANNLHADLGVAARVTFVVR